MNAQSRTSNFNQGKKNYFVGELQWEEVSGKVIQNIQEIVVEKS